MKVKLIWRNQTKATGEFMIECTIFGGILLDKYLETEVYPERGQDGLITNEFSMAGGCTINMAATFNNLGGNAHMVSYIGTDRTGCEIMEYLNRHGFSGKFIKQIEGETGYSLVILEKSGERTFLTKKGVESRYDPALLQDGAADIRNVMITGYYLLCDNTPALIKSLWELREQCGHFLFDPGPLVGQIDPKAMEQVLKMADILTVNETEAESITLPNDDSKIIIMKKGNAGGTVILGGRSFDYQAVDSEPVDTTGAGDSFAAGLMFGVLSGLDIRQAVDLAAESAAKTVAVKGPHGFWKR